MATAAAETVGSRLAGERPGRMRALATSTVVGFAAAALTYKLLRSGGEPE
jgi:2-methylcitrate dehydratase PrpD